MSDGQDKQPATSPDQQAPNNNNTASDHKRSSKESLNPITCQFSHTVKEAVAIAAGKKESDGDDDDGKNIRSNMLCYLYWLLVVLILGLISFTVWLSIQLARRHSEMNDHRKNFDFDDMFNGTFKPKTFQVTWVKSDLYVYTKHGHLFSFNITSNATERIMDNSVTELMKPISFSISKDLRYILLQYDVKKVWRHSYMARYAIHDTHVSPGVPRLHFLGESKSIREMSQSQQLQYAEMSPTSNAVVFVSSNNLFYKESLKKAVRQLTFSGLEGEVYNGIADWTYENILSRTSAVWWSPNSRYLCYLSINSSQVTKFSFMRYSGANASTISFPHPKAIPQGQIPKVTVKVVDTDELKDESFFMVLEPPPEFANTDHYVVQVAWIEENKVLVVWHNRFHTQSISTAYDVMNGKFRNVHYYTVSDGWINLSPQVVPVIPGKSYITIMQDVTTSWEHMVLINTEQLEGKESERPTDAAYLTHELKDTPEIVGYDDGVVFYLSSNGDPSTRHLYRLHLNSKTPKCLTCNVTECQYVSASFGPEAKYYILGCLGPQIPKYKLRGAHSNLDMILEDNKEMANALSAKILPEVKIMSVRLGENHNVTLKIHFPQEEGSKRFPLLIQAFGEPGETIATRKYELGWETYLASKEEVVVAKVDTRGKGLSYKKHVYTKIAQNDVDDLLTVGLHLKTNLEMVDPAKVAIWGWGFAGFLTMHALANETDVYPCGIAGGSLFDSDFYDAPTFERYMGSSVENRIGYVKSDITRKLELLRNKKLAIIQGTADDNIRYTSSLKATKMLSNYDIPYRFQIYQDLDSYSLTPNRHAYHFMTEFLKQDCFVYFWKHETKTWVVDKTVKKDKFRIKQFCV